MALDDKPYVLGGNTFSQQAEPSTANRGAGTVQLRILVELEVISFLLHRLSGVSEDLRQMREDVAASIT